MFVVCVVTLLQLSYTLACPHLNKIDNLCFLVVWGIIGVYVCLCQIPTLFLPLRPPQPMLC